MITRSQLRQFLAVVDTGNFTRAAERIGVTQPSLSVGIARLEEAVGARLFVREKRRVRLTDAGNRLVGQARALEREFRLIEANLADANASADPVRLGVLPSLATGLLTRLSLAYAADRPLTLVEAGDADLRRRLSEGRLDAILTILRESETGLATMKEGYAALLGADHPLAGRASLKAQELAGETMIARRSCEILADTSKFFTACGVRPHFLMRSSNDERCLALVREGLAITTGPRSLAGEGIVAVGIEGYDFSRTIGLICAHDGMHPALESAWHTALDPAGGTR
jgi:DNA-binding transcriptional LysR family regulator